MFTFDRIMNFMLKDLDPDSVQKSKKFPPIFNVEVKLKDICKCTNLTLFPEKCSSCQKDLVEEQSDWNLIYQIMNVHF